MSSGRSELTFQRKLVSTSSGERTDISSETSRDFCSSSQHNALQDIVLQVILFLQIDMAYGLLATYL